MSKPVVYNYKTAEDKIARLRQLVLYMGETIAKLSSERDRYREQLYSFPFKVDDWIPISEREPDTADHVLVTIKWAEDDFEVCEIDYGVTRYEATITKLPCISKDIIKHIVAWRPLPEAYKGE